MGLFAALPTVAESITDGDRPRLNGVAYRLWGIDTSEAEQVCPDAWPAGSLATTRLQQLVSGKNVVCEKTSQDRNRRTVAVCRVGGQDLGVLIGPRRHGLGLQPG